MILFTQKHSKHLYHDSNECGGLPTTRNRHGKKNKQKRRYEPATKKEKKTIGEQNKSETHVTYIKFSESRNEMGDEIKKKFTWTELTTSAPTSNLKYDTKEPVNNYSMNRIGSFPNNFFPNRSHLPEKFILPFHETNWPSWQMGLRQHHSKRERQSPSCQSQNKNSNK